MQDVYALVPAFSADADELRCGPLKPGRRHPSIVVPNGSKAVPIAGIPPHHPILDQIANGGAVYKTLIDHEVMACESRNCFALLIGGLDFIFDRTAREIAVDETLLIRGRLRLRNLENLLVHWRKRACGIGIARISR